MMYLEDYSNNIDFVRNPLNNKPMEKYGDTWYYLIRNGYSENMLENLPIIDKEFVINPKTKQPIEKYGKTWYDLTQQGYSKEKLNKLPLINNTNQVTYVHKLDLNLNKPKRGGVILYTVINKQIFFGLGVDKKYNELTDFSGGISRKDATAIDGALREFCEETEGLFSIKENVMHSPVIVDKHNLIMFLYTDEHPDDITYNFQAQEKTHKSEIKDIVWVTEQELKLAIQLNLPYIYSRLRNFLAKFGNFYDYLR